MRAHDKRRRYSGLRYTPEQRAEAVAIYRARGMAAAQVASGASDTSIKLWAGSLRGRGGLAKYPDLTRERAAQLVEKHGSVNAAAKAYPCPYAVMWRRYNAEVLAPDPSHVRPEVAARRARGPKR